MYEKQQKVFFNQEDNKKIYWLYALQNDDDDNENHNYEIILICMTMPFCSQTFEITDKPK